jgi:uncharacterized protein YjbJ (UPF0337 family)
VADKDKIKGAGKEIEGKIEEGAGKLTGDADVEAKGKVKQVEGKVQKKVGEVKDDLRKSS